MKTITKYQAGDGSEWNREGDALKRESMISHVKLAMSALTPKPNNGNFDGYIQQSANTVLECKEKLYEIANTEGVLKWWLDSQKNDHGKSDSDLIKTHPSWFGRMLDGNHDPLDRAYHRLCTIDEQSREWNQPYFAANPGSGVDKCIG